MRAVQACKERFFLFSSFFSRALFFSCRRDAFKCGTISYAKSNSKREKREKKPPILNNKKYNAQKKKRERPIIGISVQLLFQTFIHIYPLAGFIFKPCFDTRV